MNRRSFLHGIGLGILGPWLKPKFDGGAEEIWDPGIEESGNYRLVKRLGGVDELLVQRECDRRISYSFQFNGDDEGSGWDFRECTVSISPNHPNPSFRISGPAEYDDSISARMSDGSTFTIVTFSSPTSVRVYVHADREKEIVLLTG